MSVAALTAQGLFAADGRQGDIIYRQLGKAGERVSAIGLGVTFLDNWWDYANRKCAVWMGNALRDALPSENFSHVAIAI